MDDSTKDQPLIVTARMDEKSFVFFNALRQQHFPPERNFLNSHLTLFHKLPSDEAEQISSDLQRIASATHIIELAFTGWRFLGRGVAMNVESQELARVRSEIARRRSTELTPQDKQRFRPHITIQNKVEPETARDLLKIRNEEDGPTSGFATGLELWRYLNGPWEQMAFFEFTHPADSVDDINQIDDAD